MFVDIEKYTNNHGVTRNAILCLVLTLWSITTGAYNLKMLTSRDGLTNSAVLSFGQLDNGLMLIGTCDGVNCFDGSHIFALPSTMGHSVKGNVIENIVADRDGRGWILTNHGLSVIMRTYKPQNMPSFQGARGVRLNAEGRAIVLQNSALYYHTGRDTVFVRLPLQGDHAESTRDFAMSSNYLYLFQPDGIVRYGLQRHGDNYTLGQRTQLTREVLLMACYDDNGREMLVDGDGMLWSFDMATGKRQAIVSLKTDINERGTIGSVRSMAGKLFVCFTTNGVLMLERHGDNYVKHDLGLQVGILSSYKSPADDIMWLGTDGQGVLMFIDEPETRRSLTSSVLRLSRNNPYRAIYVDNEGTLWAGTKGGGLLEIPNFNFNNINGNLERRLWLRENSGLVGNSVFALQPSSWQKGFWVATDGGLCFYDTQKRRLAGVTTDMPVEWVSAVCERGDTLWMTTQGMGIYCGVITGTAAAPRITGMQRYVLDGGKKASNNFFSMASAPDGGPLFFGNRGKGVYVFQNGILKWVKPEIVTDDNTGLYDIYAILPTKDGVWTGTGGGLSYYNYKSRRTEFFSTDNGMPNNVIHALIQDDAGHVWVSTNKGLVRILHDTHAMRIFDQTDNMEVNEYADGAAFTKDGTVYFGGINGIGIIHPAPISEVLRKDVQFQFTGLVIHGMPVNINEYLTIDGDKQTLTLNYDQNTLKLYISNFDFKAPGNYIYYYAFDKKGPWINNGSSTEINLTRLPNGHHRLFVKYADRLTGKETFARIIHIYITPPWYLAWWAQVIYILVALFVIIFFYRRWKRLHEGRRLIRETREEQARRDEVYEQKLHFLTNLVHELNTPLTLVYGPCERILSHTGIDNFIRKYVYMIQANVGRLNYLIKEIIDIRRLNTQSEDLRIRTVVVGEWVSDVAEAFNEMADSNNINYEVDIDRQLEWNLDERLLTRICANLISNAFKYSKPGATVRVQLHRTDENQLFFSVYNTGKGIAENDRQHIFDYYRVFENVEENNIPGLSSRNGLGMAICHAAVMQLGGTIDIDSVEGEYACFIVHLPWAELPEGASGEPLKPVFASLSQESTETTEVNDGGETLELAVTQRRYHEPRAHREDLPTVLVIDDNVNILELLEETLTGEYNVLTAQSGEQGFEIVKQMMPDLIVTDIMMSGMDGLELIQQLKQNKHTMHIPLVILSARRSEEQRVEGLESGADAYVSKPFSLLYLQATIARLLENRKVLKEYYSTTASAFTYQGGKLMACEEREFRDEVVSIISKNLTNADFTADDLAREMAISQRNLYRKFSKAGLSTPMEYIRLFKIDHAARLLKTTNMTIQEIIYSSGYNTRSQFYAEFRKHYGITPKEYREQNRKRDDSL